MECVIQLPILQLVYVMSISTHTFHSLLSDVRVNLFKGLNYLYMYPLSLFPLV